MSSSYGRDHAKPGAETLKPEKSLNLTAGITFEPSHALRLTGGQVHDSNAIREAAASKNAWANIPSRSNRKQRFAF